MRGLIKSLDKLLLLFIVVTVMYISVTTILMSMYKFYSGKNAEDSKSLLGTVEDVVFNDSISGGHYVVRVRLDEGGVILFDSGDTSGGYESGSRVTVYTDGYGKVYKLGSEQYTQANPFKSTILKYTIIFIVIVYVLASTKLCGYSYGFASGVIVIFSIFVSKLF